MTVDTGHHGQGHDAGELGPVDFDDPKTTRFDMVREGARRDGVEIVHYEPQFPPGGTRVERRLTRVVAGLFLLAGLFATAFVVLYIWWPWKYEEGAGPDKFYTPLLGLTLGAGAVRRSAFGVLSWGKKLMPKEVSIQDRHDGGSPEQDQRAVGQTLAYMVDEFGVKRRPLLGLSLAAGLAPVALVAAAPLIGGLIKNPHNNNQLNTTGWHPIPEAGGGER